MAGIYIHIPYCNKRCHYCDFYSTVKVLEKNELVQKIVQEAEMQKYFLGNEEIKTMYFGGGTPSILSIEEIGFLVTNITKKFKTSSDIEITLEANPDDLSKDYLVALKTIGINRLSIGIQSFSDEDLKLLNRRHNAHQAIQCVENAAKAGFNNITIDLMYGLPGLTVEKWKQNIQTALALPIVHLSAYHLTIEEGTAFYQMMKKGKIEETTEAMSNEQFRFLIDTLETEGFEHYEISNFAKNGNYSKHNSNYWKAEKYLGLGPSAHSYNGKIRQWNVSDASAYMQAINENRLDCEKEILSDTDVMNENIMLGLRTMWGINTSDFTTIFGEQFTSILLKKSTQFVQNRTMLFENNNLYLTKEGKFISDYIIRELFF